MRPYWKVIFGLSAWFLMVPTEVSADDLQRAVECISALLQQDPATIAVTYLPGSHPAIATEYRGSMGDVEKSVIRFSHTEVPLQYTVDPSTHDAEPHIRQVDGKAVLENDLRPPVKKQGGHIGMNCHAWPSDLKLSNVLTVLPPDSSNRPGAK